MLLPEKVYQKNMELDPAKKKNQRVELQINGHRALEQVLINVVEEIATEIKKNGTKKVKKDQECWKCRNMMIIFWFILKTYFLRVIS